MRPVEVEILEDDLDDILALTRSDVGVPIDLGSDVEEEDDLGFRALYEHPEALLRCDGG
jgi:hypothetical protein